jgi:hypothetical protein
MLESRDMARRIPAVLLLAFISIGCLDFTGAGSDEPPVVRPPRLVDVTIEYVQPNVCASGGIPCDNPVVFFGSWMRGGAEFTLTREPDTFVYRGIARGVPVNYPPARTESPYQVLVYDPYLHGTPSVGNTGLRLTVGGEDLTSIVNGGTPDERARVYIDENGHGHNPI